MNTHAEKTSETKHQSVASKDSQNQKTGHATSQFVDSRPAAIAQMKLQEATNNSPQVSKLSALQNLASNGPQAQQTAQFQVIANYHASQQQPSELSGQAIQKEENNTGLPDQLKAGMESRSGMKLDHVRVHHNSPKPATVQAHAYAQGSNIHLAPGQAKHLPHELGHVVQQAQGRVKLTTSVNGMAVNESPKLEKEADTMGAKAAQLKPKQNKSRAVAGSVAQKKSAVKQELGFVENRPDAVKQRKLREIANNSPQAMPVKDFQDMTSNSPMQCLTKRNIVPLAFDKKKDGTSTAVVQRAGASDVMWDDYFDAYENLMSVKRNTIAVVDHTWRQYFYHLEALLYRAKDTNDETQHTDANVQTAHTNLMNLGVVPPAPEPDANQVTARTLIVAANARWAVFRNDPTVNRGAWAGSDNHGAQPGDYAQTGNGPINILRQKAIALGAWWVMQSDTAPSGWALHRRGIDGRGDFIYHL